jgi:hypothetical protein
MRLHLPSVCSWSITEDTIEENLSPAETFFIIQWKYKRTVAESNKYVNQKNQSGNMTIWEIAFLLEFYW